MFGLVVGVVALSLYTSTRSKPIQIPSRASLEISATLRVPEDHASIQVAVNAANPGDIISIAAGSYSENITLDRKVTLEARSFDQNNPQQNSVKLSGAMTINSGADSWDQGSVIRGFYFSGSDKPIVSNSPVTVEYSYITAGSDGVSFEPGGGGIVRGNLIENTGDDCVDVDHQTQNILIQNNILKNCGDDGLETRQHDDNIPQQVSLTIRGNRIEGVGEDGVQIMDYDNNSNRYYRIEDNLILNSQMAGIGIMPGSNTSEDYSAAPMPEPADVVNNTFVGNNHGIAGGANIAAVNNIFSGHNVALKNVAGNSTAVKTLFWQNGTDNQGSNIDTTSVVNADPQLNAQYELSSGSAAVDNGVAQLNHRGRTVLNLSTNEYTGSAPDLGWKELGLSTTVAPTSAQPTQPENPQITPPPNFKVAFIGDSGYGAEFEGVLNLIKNEGAGLVLHQGDFDYADDPDGFFAKIDQILGANFPYLGSIGNHDSGSWGGYAQHFINRMQSMQVPPDDPSLADEKYATVFNGLKLVFVGENGNNSEFAQFVTNQLNNDNHLWKICSWHKNQTAMQVGGKGNNMGWEVYENCRTHGGIIATGHEHSYSRTKTLSNMQNQTVDATCPQPDNLCVEQGKTFVFVSGLGGKSIRDQQRCLPATPPYGCNGEWASIYTSNQNAQYGALFIEFHVDGDPAKARGYFKDIDGQTVDQFTITTNASGGSPPGSGDPTPTTMPTPTFVTPKPSQGEGEPTPYPHCQPLGDIDCSCEVNALDLNYLIAQYYTSDAKADLDDSGQVNALDLSRLLSNFGKGC